MNENPDSQALFPSCPFLPECTQMLSHQDLTALGRRRDLVFHQTALHYAQNLLITGYPAKSLLLITRALSCRLEEVSYLSPDRPYHAVAWILRNRHPDLFIGNPRRHYQHLATRMVEPHKKLRTWRAWACWYLARLVLDEETFPPDVKQIREEGVVEPRKHEIAQALAALSPTDDVESWQDAVETVRSGMEHWKKGAGALNVRLASLENLPEIRRLAQAIWPACYGNLLSAGQIRYMLERMYSLETMEREVLELSAQYALLSTSGGEAVGYLCWLPESTGGGAFLSKLYLSPEHHGRGYGTQALHWVFDHVQERGIHQLRLRVNRHNLAAIRAYRRSGFEFERDECTDIGEGFVMDDHVMLKTFS